MWSCSRSARAVSPGARAARPSRGRARPAPLAPRPHARTQGGRAGAADRFARAGPAAAQGVQAQRPHSGLSFWTRRPGAKVGTGRVVRLAEPPPGTSAGLRREWKKEERPRSPGAEDGNCPLPVADGGDPGWRRRRLPLPEKTVPGNSSVATRSGAGVSMTWQRENRRPTPPV